MNSGLCTLLVCFDLEGQVIVSFTVYIPASSRHSFAFEIGGSFSLAADDQTVPTEKRFSHLSFLSGARQAVVEMKDVHIFLFMLC